MKYRFRSLVVALLALPVAATVFAQAGEAPKSNPPKKADLDVELGILVNKVKAKIQAGAHTEEELSDELKAFDRLFADHKGDKDESVPQILAIKGMIYVQALQNVEKGVEMFEQIKAQFPDTESGKDASRILGILEKQRASAKLQASLVPGAAFPDFQEKDLAGADLSIAKFKGKIVLVDFWATWCGPCVEELPNVIAAYKKYHDKGFEIVGISLDQSEAALKGFLKDRTMPWPQYFDGRGWESKLGAQYGITSIPATFLLDRNGKIVARGLRGAELDAELARLLDKP